MRVWHLSVAYIGPKSRTDRPRKTKIGTEVAHITRDSDTTFKAKRSKVNLHGRGHIVAASPTTCLDSCCNLIAAMQLNVFERYWMFDEGHLSHTVLNCYFWFDTRSCTVFNFFINWLILRIQKWKLFLPCLMNVDPPGKPGEPECEGTTEDSITLTWEPPMKDGGKPIKGYIVEKREKGSKRWTKYVIAMLNTLLLLHPGPNKQLPLSLPANTIRF